NTPGAIFAGETHFALEFRNEAEDRRRSRPRPRSPDQEFSMKRILVLLSLAVALTLLGANSDHHVTANLAANGDSGVHGTVQVTQSGKGGSEIVVSADGLHPGTTYSSFYYEHTDCTEPADHLGDLHVDASGHGEVHGTIDDDLDEVGSVSVRLGPGYGTLLACAKIH